MPSREGKSPVRPCFPARAKDSRQQAGLLASGSLLGSTFPFAQWSCLSFARRLQLRVQRRIFTGFPFHPGFPGHLLLGGRIGKGDNMVKPIPLAGGDDYFSTPFTFPHCRAAV